MPKRLRFPRWIAARNRHARRHEISTGLSVHHRRLGCETLEDRRLLSLGGELNGNSVANPPKTLTDLPFVAQYAISSAVGKDQTAYHATAGTTGLTLSNPANRFTAQVQLGVLQVSSGSNHCSSTTTSPH